MQDASNGSDLPKVETAFVRLEGGEVRSIDFELPESAMLIGTWGNMTTPGGEIPRWVIKDQQSDRELVALSSNHDDEDGHNRAYLEHLLHAPANTEKIKREFEGHKIEMGSTSTETVSWNATASGPPLS